MGTQGNSGWDPASPHDWAKRFGFVASKLFPPKGLHVSTDDAVLRDGRLLSFTLLAKAASEPDQEAFSWSWSANTRYVLVPHPDKAELRIHRWDQPVGKCRLLNLIEVAKRPSEVIELLRSDRPIQEQNAVDHVIQVFRSLRSRVDDPGTAIRLLHHLLRPTDGAVAGDQTPVAWSRTDVNALRDRLLGGNTRLGLSLHPELLLRHAAAELFQEAHVEADRQVYFFGMSPPAKLDKLPPEVRYTPAHLARVLGEVALSKLGKNRGQIRALDPACGSGVFLTELVNLAFGDDRSHLEVAGYDTSSVAVELAQSCVGLAVSTEQEDEVKVAISERDSLEENWGETDLVLMNPPFRAYPDLDKGERAAVKGILDKLNVGRPDKALAFLWKAWQSLKDGGVLGAVLPAALLSGDAGQKVRQAIQKEGTIHVLGRFESHTFFRHSLIETGFIVVQKSEMVEQRTFIAVVASVGGEDDSIRCLRLLNQNNEAGETEDVYRLNTNVLKESDWFPRRRGEYKTMTSVLGQGYPKADELFTISQGMRTGLKEAFLLTAAEWKSLPKSEQEYFRPAAGQGTIRDGRLYEDLYAFYPYSRQGVRIQSEAELSRKLPTYVQGWLRPVKSQLALRKKIDKWYLPTWPRNWQYVQQAKLASTYFGQAGSFAVDTVGRHVVMDGHVWIPKKLDKTTSLPELTDLLHAYCALLNSTPFQNVLKIHARSLQGGQIRLEPRFINNIPIPDLGHERFQQYVLPKLSALGKRINEDGLKSVISEVDVIAQSLYGM